MLSERNTTADTFSIVTVALATSTYSYIPPHSFLNKPEMKYHTDLNTLSVGRTMHNQALQSSLPLRVITDVLLLFCTASDKSVVEQS